MSGALRGLALAGVGGGLLGALQSDEVAIVGLGEIRIDGADRLGEFPHELGRSAAKNSEGRDVSVRWDHSVVQDLDVVLDANAMADNTALADVHIASDRLRGDHALRLNRHIVSNVHLDILHMPMLLAKCRSNNHILFYYDISSEIYRCHVTPHDNL